MGPRRGISYGWLSAWAREYTTGIERLAAYNMGYLLVTARALAGSMLKRWTICTVTLLRKEERRASIVYI